MTSQEHKQHLSERVSHNNCPECSADRERRFARTQPFHYGHVREYLAYVRPRLQAIREGNQTPNARIWHRDFVQAMNRRISSHMPATVARKQADSYLERLEMTRYPGSTVDSGYLRDFARKGASCL